MAFTDLSTIHRPITGMFPRPQSKEEWEQYMLSRDQLDFFEENGFLPGIKMLNEEQIQVLRTELADVADPGHPGHGCFYEFHSNESADPETVLFHALGAWRLSPGLHDVLWNPRFLMAAYQLLGNRSVRFWHDQLFAKPPKKGGVVAWHQDYSYWTRTTPIAHLTCWCSLDDATRQNGCLQYIPGSHRWGLLPRPVIAGELEGIRQFLTEEQQATLERPRYAEVRAGEAVFHHPLTLHGSGENTSHLPRRAFVINVFADGTMSCSDHPLLEGVPVIPNGGRIEGPFFPLLFSGAV